MPMAARTRPDRAASEVAPAVAGDEVDAGDDEVGAAEVVPKVGYDTGIEPVG